jgi:hypothetical protein
MLAVANAQRPALGLPAPPLPALSAGAALGVLAIPAYALGWRAAAQVVAPFAPRAAPLVAVAGAASAFVGSAIHGLTAVEIRRSVASPAADRPPLEAMADPGSPLLALWLLAAALVLVASAAFARSALRAPGPGPRLPALLNPALATVALAVAALPSELLRSFLAPAAPNLAHLLFFLACARTLGAPPPAAPGAASHREASPHAYGARAGGGARP